MTRTFDKLFLNLTDYVNVNSIALFVYIIRGFYYLIFYYLMELYV